MTLAEIQEVVKNDLNSPNKMRKKRIITRIDDLLDYYNFVTTEEVDKKTHDDLEDIKDALEKSDDNSNISELANKYLKIVDELEARCKKDSENYDEDDWVYFKDIDNKNDVDYKKVDKIITTLYYDASSRILDELKTIMLSENFLDTQVPDERSTIKAFNVIAKTYGVVVNIKVSPEGDTNDLNNLCPLSLIKDVYLTGDNEIAYELDEDKMYNYEDKVENEVVNRYAR